MRKIIALGSILILGFALRAYNLNFPTLGYHNMNENKYLSMAKEMSRTGDYLTKRVYFYNAFEGSPAIKNDAQPPLVAYQILLAWNLLGENLWGVRLLNVIFGLLGIVMVYLISKLLFKSRKLSLACALFCAVIPLGVFFSRNIQPESPAFFFMLLGSFFYLRFSSSLKKIDLFLGGIFFLLAWFYKFNFLIGMVPCVCCLPFKSIFKKKKEFIQYAALLLLPLAGILIYLFWFRTAWGGQWQYPFRPWEIFSFDYWNNHGDIILWYTKGENFTFLFCLLASWGAILAFFKKSSLLNIYIAGWILAAVIYGVIFPEDIFENNYSQMPFLAAVCICSGYAISFIADEINKNIKMDVLPYVIICVLAISGSAIYQSLYRMHATVFLGQDVAGETLKEFTGPDEKIFLLTNSQGYAIARYAQRYVGWPNTLSQFKATEEKYKIRFVCMYPGENVGYLSKENPQLFAYIEDNYKIREVGLLEDPNRLGYLILEKGKTGGRKISDVLESVSGLVRPRSIYKVLGRYIFYYAVRPGV